MNWFALTCGVWLKGLGFLAFAMELAGCASTAETRDPDRFYRAYGDTWVYSKTEIRTTRHLTLDSPHGFLGPRTDHEERHLIRNSAGKEISIPDNLYALQRDGTMKKIRCCKYFRETGHLYNIDDKLVFVFDNAREFITDCFIYPSGRPNNEWALPENRIYGVTVFAEFDPQADVFKTRSFNAGDNHMRFEYRAAELRSGRTSLTVEQHDAFLYAKRKPFMCESSGPVPAPDSSTSELDIGAYQAGATRLMQVSVAPGTTDALLHQLQSLAVRKGFRTWKTNGPDGEDPSLAIQGEEILTIAAGDEDGVWRIGFYRRMAKPSFPLPSEESVDALAREIKHTLANVRGIAFPFGQR